MARLDRTQEYTQRCWAVKLHREQGLNFSEIAQQMGRSRQWVSRWCHRAGCHDRSSRPHRSPHQTDPAIEAEIVTFARDTGWGRHRLHRELKYRWQDYPDQLDRLPSASGIERIRRRHGLVQPRPLKEVKPRLERDYGQPNDLWQADAMEDKLPDGQKVATYKITDCASRTELLSYSAPSLTSEDVVACDLVAFGVHGLPKALQRDNGTQFVNTQHPELVSPADAVLLALGVEAKHSRVRCPQDNGIVERLMRTTREEGLGQRLRRVELGQPRRRGPLVDRDGQIVQDLADYRRAQERFQFYYNEERCHTATDTPPMAKYRPSERCLPEGFGIESIPFWREEQVTDRVVKQNGTIRLAGKEYYVSQRLAHQRLKVELKGTQAQVLLDDQVVKVLTLKPRSMSCNIGPCTTPRYKGA